MLLTSCVTFGELLNQSELPFPQVGNDRNDSSYQISVRVNY